MDIKTQKKYFYDVIMLEIIPGYSRFQASDILSVSGSPFSVTDLHNFILRHFLP